MANSAGENAATEIRPNWLRPLAFFAVAMLHVSMFFTQPMKQRTASPIDSIEVTLAPLGDDSAESQQRVDEIVAAAATETSASPPAEAIPAPALESQSTAEPRQTTEAEDHERERRSEAPKPRRKNQEIADRNRKAQMEQQAARRGSSSGQTAGGHSRANYAGLLMAELNRRRFYPAAARSAGATGSVGVAFTVGPSGRVTSHSITQSSGFAMLDAAARSILAAIHAPPPPNGFFAASTSIRFYLN